MFLTARSTGKQSPARSTMFGAMKRFFSEKVGWEGEPDTLDVTDPDFWP